jgi:flagellar hook-basal body complex protein FliE
MRIDGIQFGAYPGIPEVQRSVAAGKAVPSFKETLASFVDDVNGMQKSASEAQQKFLTGETTDVHQVMSKSEEAKTGFNMLMELRNKSVDGFQEMMRIKL